MESEAQFTIASTLLPHLALGARQLDQGSVDPAQYLCTGGLGSTVLPER